VAKSWHGRLCGSTDHLFSRRSFVGASGAAAAAFGSGLAGLEALHTPLLASEIEKRRKRVLMIFLNGGCSQFETWDPKPGADTGGPFVSIPTTIPGYHVSELMPKMARRVHKMSIIRSTHIRRANHHDEPLYGNKPKSGVVQLPSIGSILSRELADPKSPLPRHVFFSNFVGPNFTEVPGFLGPAWGPVNVIAKKLPPRLPELQNPQSEIRLAPAGNALPESLTDEIHKERGQLRDALSSTFALGRQRDATLSSYEGAFSRVRGLMDSARLFDIDKEPQHVRDSYGPTAFGQHALIARRLIEAGVPYVRVNRGWWDHHGQNFEGHHEMVPEFDYVLSVLLDDLEDRGLLEDTLVVTFSEMGRTPAINPGNGRDHYHLMTATLTGCGIKPGVVHGSTDANGVEIADGEVLVQNLFATIFKAVGIDHQKENHAADGRPIPLTDYGTEPVDAVLA
jgi:hypothetical protein